MAFFCKNNCGHFFRIKLIFLFGTETITMINMPNLIQHNFILKQMEKYYEDWQQCPSPLHVRSSISAHASVQLLTTCPPTHTVFPRWIFVEERGNRERAAMVQKKVNIEVSAYFIFVYAEYSAGYLSSNVVNFVLTHILLLYALIQIANQVAGQLCGPM